MKVKSGLPHDLEYPWTKTQLEEVRKATDLAMSLAINKTRLAEWCGVSRSAVLAWQVEGMIPPGHIVAVSAATGVPMASLRPDIYRKADNRVNEYRKFCFDQAMSKLKLRLD